MDQGSGRARQEIWTSDGTDAGTVAMEPWSPGSCDFFPTDLTEVCGTLFFAGGWSNEELWKAAPTDRTLLRSAQVMTISPLDPPLSDILPRNPVDHHYLSPFTSGQADPELVLFRAPGGAPSPRTGSGFGERQRLIAFLPPRA